MNQLKLDDYWPIYVICIAMIVAAVIDGWKLKVPNWLTFPIILSGWLLGLGYDLGWLARFHPEITGEGSRLWSSIVGTFLGLGLLLPIYAIGGMGAGDVKMSMGYGAWVGAFFGLMRGTSVIFWAFCIGVVMGGVIGLGMILYRRDLRHNLSNTQNILQDFVRSGSFAEVAEKGTERRAKEPKLPYGIPLCIGFVGYLWYHMTYGVY
ncbi:MAG: prepilin peptidase [Gemmataceae bacterium]